MNDDLRQHVLLDTQKLRQLQEAGAVSVLVVWSAETRNDTPDSLRERIPGALDTTLEEDFSAPGGGTAGSRPLPDIDALQARVRGWGIGRDTPVVVYDHSGGLQAARAWWVLRWAGITDVRLLDGGLQAWRAEGLPVQQGQGALPAPSDVRLSAGHLPTLDADEAARLARQGVLLDSRIRVNYLGGESTVGEPARGHIPGAISLPAPDNLDAHQRFLGAAALREHYARHGVFDGKPVGVYCGAGVSAAHNILVLASLGIEAPLYVGSWSAWSAEPDRPVARGAEPG